MERDFRSDIEVKAVDTISVTAASTPETLAGTAIDTKGARGLEVAVEPGEAIGTDVINVTFYECDTSGGTYTAVDSSKIIGPSTQVVDKDANNNLLVVGVFGTKRYVKPYIVTTTVADDLTVNVYPIVHKAMTVEAFVSTAP